MSDFPGKTGVNQMARLIPAGLPNQGHSIDFEYEGEDRAKKCFMVCECGWKIKIESFRHPWSLIETRVKIRTHMKELGLDSDE
jgi:hypothetical protein